ncbi:LamG-like jellyroll fold domain-containing protein [Chitinophaga nivalis]|uniref:S8 family serine peptidase n=1 Tax=Chitinophaga nivalis TaxID=2991709 RepID=A0ABT3IPA1_9BACT|nr:LamG-like jellyroll fold domain-containing protein [Chitinophaga nivalis]MCW3464514.1 S8 family serine peptidase [Chitinophaga nivalis]MCW3485795.1 S8 family serine peptidase [Chitinophaga nivalis]
MKKMLLLFFGCCMCTLLLHAQLPGPREKDYRILHVNKKFTPPKGYTANDVDIRAAGTGGVQFTGDQYFLVQFEQLPTAGQREQLQQMGITLLDYFPNLAYYAHFRREIRSDRLRNFGVRTILPIDESFKLAEDLYTGRIPSHAKKGRQVEVTVMSYANAVAKEVEPALGRYGTITGKPTALQWTVLVSPEQLTELAGIKAIKYIEPVAAAPEPEKDNKEIKPEDIFSNDHGRSNFLNSGFGGLLYNGAGVNVMVRENGMHKGPDLQGRVMDGSNQPGEPTSHSSGVAGYLGSAGNINPRDRSNAWGANILGISGQNTYTLYDDPAKKIRVTNMSYGWTNDAASYSSLSAEHDNFIRTRPEAMLVYSSGNDGGDTAIGGKYNGLIGWANITGMPKHAKNLLTVSGTDYEDNFLEWTCKGPAYDGRIKPELTIEGVGGTSFAAPKVSGIFAILHQAFKTETAAATAPAALIKAILLNTADDIYNPGIDYKTGFGRPNVRRAYQTIKNRQYATEKITQGGQKSFPITVPAGTTQVRVLLYWHDYEATPGAAQALVNDLDLTVEDPGGNVALPWGLDTTATAIRLNALPTRKADHINNEEQVTIDQPVAGTYTLYVDGFNVPQGPQEFYVVYEFLQEEVVLSYPLGGESMGAGQEEYIRWDAFGTPGTFDLEYSVNNGNTWDTIATGIAAGRRQWKWTVPELAGKVLVRIKRGSQHSVSGAVSVMPVPASFKIDWVCDNALQLSWNKLPQTGVQYEIFKLGEKYMEQIGTTTDTIFGVNAPDAAAEEWYAVRAVGTGGVVGLRCNAVKKSTGLFKCNSVITGTAFGVRKDSVLLTGRVNALGKTLTQVAFEYGPTTAYGQTFAIPGTFTGTSFVPLEQQVPIQLRSGDTWHYRLKGALNGEAVYGEDRTFQPAPGNAMKFNGAETITLGSNDAVNGNKPRTIECWVKTSVYNADGGVITLPGSTGTTRGDFTLATNGADNQWKLSLWSVTRTYTLPDNKNEWHHMAITYDPANTTAILYYDGILWDTWNTGGPLTTLPGNMRLGTRSNGSAFYYNGEVDEVRIWRTVRTAAEIREHMHHPLTGTESGLVSYLNFDNPELFSYDIVSKKELAQTGALQKIKTSYPFGIGQTVTGLEAAGSQVFGAGVDVTAAYKTQDAQQVSFTKIALTSAPLNGFSATSSRIDSSFWIGHRYATTAGPLEMALTFKLKDTLPEYRPGKILLFTRKPYAAGQWQYTGTADAADSITNTVTLQRQSAYWQYLLMRDDHPFAYATVDSLVLADARAGAVTGSQYFSLSGANLPDTIQVKVPAGYQLSANDTAYMHAAETLRLATTGGALKDTKVFVRFAPAAGGSYEGALQILAGTTVLDSIFLKQEAVAVETTAGKALAFDGNGDYLEIQNLNWQPTEFTIEWWLKPKSFKNYNQSIGNGWGSFLAHADNSGGLNIGVANNAASRLQVAGAYTALNTWHHYAYTFKNGAAKIYRDGKLMDSKTGSAAPPNWSIFRIGANTGDAIDGELEEFRMWTTARTQQQIREGMHLTLTGAEPDLKLCLQFQEAQRGVVDISNNGYPVRLYNAVRVASTAPVAAGVSETQAITAAGVTDFTRTGVRLEMAATGTVPNGDVVVSRLYAAPADNLIPAAIDSSYWIINNYGSNATFTGLNKLTLYHIDGLSTTGPASYRLYRRPFNADGATWQLQGRTPDAAGHQVTYTFTAADAAVVFGQLAINRISGQSQVDTVAGQAYAFQGSNTGLKLQDLSWQPTVFTIEWWLKARTARDWNQQIGNGWGSFLMHANNDGSMSLGVANNAASRIEIPGAFNDLDTWHHYAYTFDQGKVNVYRDGILAGTQTASAFPARWTGFYVSGQEGDGIDGALDEFRIWSTARTVTEIRENMYHPVAAGTPGLKAYLQGQGQPGAGYFTEVSPNAYMVVADSDVKREASAVPVAMGVSRSATVQQAGRYVFDQTGLVLDYAATGSYPKGEVVVSRLQATPYAAPVGDKPVAGYWVVRNYGDSAAAAIAAITWPGVADSLLNQQLQQRSFLATGTWQAGGYGRPDTATGVVVTGPTTDIRNSQLVLVATNNAAPVFTVPADRVVVKDDSCRYQADPAQTGVPQQVKDDTDTLPLIRYIDNRIAGTCAGEDVIARTWQVTDHAGRTATQVQRITGKDTTAPLIRCKTAMQRSAGSGGCTYRAAGNELDVTATDNCSAIGYAYTLQGATQGSGAGTLNGVAFNAGATTITWTAKDVCGNKAVCQYTLTVNSGQLAVSIPAAYTVSPGGNAHTIYLGYGPGVIRLAAQVAGGRAPYTFRWSAGGTTAAVRVSPAIPGVYRYDVTVTDANGCTANTAVDVTVMDIRCSSRKVRVCHYKGCGDNGKELCIPAMAVPAHLAAGCRLGSCNRGDISGKEMPVSENETGWVVTISPNPATQYFTVTLPEGGALVTVRVYDMQGKRLEEISSADRVIRFGERCIPGTYIVEVIQGSKRKTMNVIKL